MNKVGKIGTIVCNRLDGFISVHGIHLDKGDSLAFRVIREVESHGELVKKLKKGEPHEIDCLCEECSIKRCE